MAASPDLLKILPRMSHAELKVVERQCAKENDYENMKALVDEIVRRQKRAKLPWQKPIA